jgi:hypothetical protein
VLLLFAAAAALGFAPRCGRQSFGSSFSPAEKSAP